MAAWRKKKKLAAKHGYLCVRARVKHLKQGGMGGMTRRAAGIAYHSWQQTKCKAPALKESRGRDMLRRKKRHENTAWRRKGNKERAKKRDALQRISAKGGKWRSIP